MFYRPHFLYTRAEEKEGFWGFDHILSCTKNGDSLLYYREICQNLSVDFDLLAKSNLLLVREQLAQLTPVVAMVEIQNCRWYPYYMEANASHFLLLCDYDNGYYTALDPMWSKEEFLIDETELKQCVTNFLYFKKISTEAKCFNELLLNGYYLDQGMMEKDGLSDFIEDLLDNSDEFLDDIHMCNREKFKVFASLYKTYLENSSLYMEFLNIAHVNESNIDSLFVAHQKTHQAWKQVYNSLLRLYTSKNHKNKYLIFCKALIDVLKLRYEYELLLEGWR
jgi:hypothetical protein